LPGCRCRPSRSVAAQLAFAAPLSTLSRFRVGPQGLPCARLRTVRKNSSEESSMTFASSSERSELTRNVVVAIARVPDIRLSWDSLECVPSSDMPAVRPLPMALPPSSAVQFPLADTFRPRGFSPPRRFTPHFRSRACCIPIPEGVRHVSESKPPRPEPRIRKYEPPTGLTYDLSRSAFHTPRRSPPTCSRVASLRPLPPRRCASASKPHKCCSAATTLDLEALLRRWVRDVYRLLPD